MVVYHADGLHERVRHRRTDESKSMFFTFFGQCSDSKVLRRSFVIVFPAMNQRFAFHDSPQKSIQTPVFLLNAQSGAGVGNRGFNFSPIADDVRVSE